MGQLGDIYQALLQLYGHQGWWPLISIEGTNPTKTGSVKGYHPGDYSYPKNIRQRFEICVGAILTQNTAWPNVEKALIGLQRIGALAPKKILSLDEETIKEAIRPAGYFNQKYTYLVNFSHFFLKLKGTPTREQLLKLRGVGNETADSMMLYAFCKPEFVVDAYTRRFLLGNGLTKGNESYMDIKSLFENSLTRDVKMFQEYHALIVEHEKRNPKG